MKILVLDNDRSMRELFALALRMQGLESVTVGTVEEAEAALPDVAALLLDFHLGGGHSGAVVARRWAAAAMSAARRMSPISVSSLMRRISSSRARRS